MAIDISSIIQKHLTNTAEEITESTGIFAASSGGIQVDFESVVNNISSDSAEKIIEAEEANHTFFLTESEISRIRGAITSTAIASNVASGAANDDESLMEALQFFGGSVLEEGFFDYFSTDVFTNQMEEVKNWWINWGTDTAKNINDAILDPNLVDNIGNTISHTVDSIKSTIGEAFHGSIVAVANASAEVQQSAADAMQEVANKQFLASIPSEDARSIITNMTNHVNKAFPELDASPKSVAIVATVLVLILVILLVFGAMALIKKGKAKQAAKALLSARNLTKKSKIKIK